jgi:hypothetical protein
MQIENKAKLEKKKVRQKKILYPSNILIVKPIMIEDIIAQKNISIY